MEGDQLHTILAYSCGSAHTDDYLFSFVPKLTRQTYVMMNELETNGTSCHDRGQTFPDLQASGLAAQEFCAWMFRMPYAILANDGK